MKILILGNGFDLAHHLPTRYSDFLDFINAFMEPDSSGYSDFVEKIKTDKPKIYAEIEDDIKDNVLLDYFLSIYKKRCNEGKNGWIDFESEISTIVQNLDTAKKDIESKISGPNDHIPLDEGLLQYLLPIISEKKEGQNKVCYSFKPSFFDYQANMLRKAFKNFILPVLNISSLSLLIFNSSFIFILLLTPL